MKKLNEKGLKKLVEYLETKYPGISRDFVLSDNKMLMNDLGIEIIASVNENLAAVPEPTVADPASLSAPAPQQTSMAVGKGPNSQVKQVGRAGVKKVNDQQTEKMADQMKQFFPDKAQLQQALMNIATSLK